MGALLNLQAILLAGAVKLHTHDMPLSVLCAALYSRLSKRLGNKHDYYHMMGVGASGLAYGLQVPSPSS